MVQPGGMPLTADIALAGSQLKPTPPPGQKVRRRSTARTLSLIGAWLFGIPLAVALAVYVVLLIHPIPLPFISKPLRSLVVASMPPGTEVELGEMALALEGYTSPVIRFTPVTYKDNTTGGVVQMDALEVGFSPLRALIGQPGANITVVGPHIQINQDLFGPRLANLEVVTDAKSGEDLVRVIEGTTPFPDVSIKSERVDVENAGTTPNPNLPLGTKLRSDNDWLIYNMNAAEKGIADIVKQAQDGRFSRLVIKNGQLTINDKLYSVMRTFRRFDLDIAPGLDGRSVEGQFVIDYGGTVMNGSLQRDIQSNGDARLRLWMTNIELSAFSTMAGDGEAPVALVGGIAVSAEMDFNGTTHEIKGGSFHVDLTGTDVRVNQDYFPVVSSIVTVDWDPGTATFTLQDASIAIGQSSGKLSGVIRMGVDDRFGPTMAMSITGSDVVIHPNDMDAPAQSFDTISFKGWSAALYGAFGIDQAVLSRKGATIFTKGRVDNVRAGLGFDMDVAIKGINVDDMKRFWPYFLGTEQRDWFVKRVASGTIDAAKMKFAFPVGALGTGQQLTSIPPNSISVDMEASGVTMNPVDGLAPIELDGKARLQMRDAQIGFAADGAHVTTDKGPVAVTNAAMSLAANLDSDQTVQVSGNLFGGVPALTAVLAKVQPAVLESKDLPVDLNALAGTLSVAMKSNIVVDKAGTPKKIGYVLDGSVQDFGSTEAIQGHKFTNAQLAFTATEAGFHVGGNAQLDGVTAVAAIDGIMNGNAMPAVTVNATVNLDDLGKLGVDASQFASGKVAVLVKPGDNGAMDLSVDLKNAAIHVDDIGITKAAGAPGSIKATLVQNGDTSQINDLSVGFGPVKVKGNLVVDAKKGLTSAQFSDLGFAEGDSAELSVAPISGGYQVKLKGDQLDLRPMLKKTFSLDQGSGGPKASSTDDTLMVQADLKRALGFYKTNLYNVNLDLALKGSDVKKANLQAQVGSGSALSVTTNPSPNGRTFSVAFNDMGSVLRMLGVYAQIQGGEGSLVLQQNTSTKVDQGQFTLNRFSIVDEKKVGDLLSGHSQLSNGNGNNLTFDAAQVNFTRRSDRIQVNQAVLKGSTIGGTVNGYIYTGKKQYDLAGTFVPMFGINTAFQKLLGPLGGKDNTGLFGITFAVQGALDKPDFKINPMSAISGPLLRPLFEFKPKEQPAGQ